MMSFEKEEIKITLLKCLTDQLNEIELFKSMYSNNELILSDSGIIDNITQFINNDTEYVPQHLDFTLFLKVGINKIEISINLPSFYPVEEPDICIRCNQFNRQQETNLNSELAHFIKTIHSDEVCLLTIISWIQEHIEKSESLQSHTNKAELVIENKLHEDDKFERIWIFSHHIYNKKKREEIVKLAKELNITGFCLPGKPGIVCIEGSENSCKEWWKIIKSLTWKKIGIRKTETFDMSERCEHQRFHNFEEIHFQNPASKHSKHSDMSEFSKYIELHGLSDGFNEIFGLNCLTK